MPALSDPTSLRRLPLFNGIALEDLGVLNGMMRRQVLPAGGRILLSEQLEDTTYIVQSGVVRIVAEQANGTELIVALMGTGDVIGAMTIGSRGDAVYSILPLEETSLFWIDRATFERCLKTMPDLSANLCDVLGRRVVLAHERVEALAGLDVRTRLVRHLLLLVGQFGEPVLSGSVRIPLHLNQSDLGRLVGASRVRINHALAELTRRGIVKQDADRCLVVFDLKQLTSLS